MGFTYCPTPPFPKIAYIYFINVNKLLPAKKKQCKSPEAVLVVDNIE